MPMSLCSLEKCLPRGTYNLDGKGHIWFSFQPKRFRQTIDNNILLLRIVKDWDRILGKAMEYLPLDIFHVPQNQSRCSPALGR